MIDLNKPIRRKGSNHTIAVVEAPFRVYHINSDDYVQYSREELERDYENIPEPRKPQRWWIDEASLGYGASGNVYEVKNWPGDFDLTRVINVIEWPQDAPLPDWPEGYG